MRPECGAGQFETLARVFQSEPEVLAAWIFGSVAQDRAHSFSDVDFAVLLSPDAPTRLDRFVLLDRLARKLGTVLGLSDQQVDVAALNDTGVVFQHQVLRTGKLIFERDRKACELFTWSVLRRYLDFRPTLDIFDWASGRAPRPARTAAPSLQSSSGARV